MRSRKPRPDGQRVVTIGSLFRTSSRGGDARVPYVRLSGHWLQRIGFDAGARLLIAPEQEKLVITIAPPEPVAEPVNTAKRRRCRPSERERRRMPHLAVAFLRRRVASFRQHAE
jgi:hypothetical protein